MSHCTRYVKFQNLPKRFYLLDIYCGLVPELLTEEERKAGLDDAYEGAYPDCYEETKKRFDDFWNVVLVRGAVPGTLPQVPSETIAFLHIDMNIAFPEIAAAEYFWPKIVQGAVLEAVFDPLGTASAIQDAVRTKPGRCAPDHSSARVRDRERAFKAPVIPKDSRLSRISA